MTRYPSRTIILHWLSGALLLFLLVTGTLVLSYMPNTVEKLGSFKIHMILGFIATLLSLVRIGVILKSPQPAALEMTPFRQTLMKVNHIAIYAVIVAIGVSGFVLAQSASLGQIVFFGADTALYDSFKDFGVGVVHGFLTKVLLFLVVTHVLGVISYSIAHKRNIMNRMWF